MSGLDRSSISLLLVYETLELNELLIWFGNLLLKVMSVFLGGLELLSEFIDLIGKILNFVLFLLCWLEVVLQLVVFLHQLIVLKLSKMMN